MRRSADFSYTVKHGVRASQPDIVVHACRCEVAGATGPKVGFVVAKSVGCAVDRHRVSRRLRHAARGVVADLDPADLIVVRALPSSTAAEFAKLGAQVHAGVRKARHLLEQR